jgi:NADPH2:quinone reductase
VRAAVYTRTGDPDVLDVIDKAVSEPGAGEVRVRIHRSGLNPTDWKSRRGASSPRTVDPPQVPGQDGAGVVDAVGSGVDPGRVGQRVWIWEAAYQRAEGTSQEFAIIPAEQAVPLPDGASFDLGAALGIPFLTAHRCLTVTEDGPRRLGPGMLAGRVVLVAGGAGAVGNAAIQLARWSDATVVTTVSNDAKALLALAAGADHVINYKELDVADEVRRIAPSGVNTIVDVAAAANAAIDVAVLAPLGSVAVYADDGGADLRLPVRALMGPNVRYQFVLVYTEPPQAKDLGVEDIGIAVRAGAVRIGDVAGLPIHHFRLDQVRDAHMAVQNAALGKVLIDVQD